MKNNSFKFSTQFTGIARKDLANVLAQVFETEAGYKGAPSFDYFAPDKDGREWRITKQNILVSPEIAYEDMEPALKALEKLATGDISFEGCRAKVTISMEGHSGITLKNLVNSVASKQKLICKALSVNDDAGFKPEFLDTINHLKIATVENFKEHLASCGGDEASPALGFEDGEISFRFFAGTLSSETIKAYVQFVHAINRQALVQKHTTSRETVTDNEKYTFRVWLLRLGFIGDEYKTTRNILLKNLEGNVAFRTLNQKEAIETAKEEPVSNPDELVAYMNESLAGKVTV